MIFLFLLEHYFFYATGHETTFTHIKWESGFHGFDGDNNNKLVRLCMGIMIFSNTFPTKFLTVLNIGKNNQKLIFDKSIKLILINATKVRF